MQAASKIKEYRRQVERSLDNEFQRRALDGFARDYPVARAKAFAGQDIHALRDEIIRIKDESIARMDALYEQFKQRAESMGVHVHMAAAADEANALIARIAAENNCRRVVKSKSMTAEETQLNHFLEEQGLLVQESDLGEWIVQLRREGPSHMVLPAIHLSRRQVAELFSRLTGQDVPPDILKLVRVARSELRRAYAQADMGISGANFAVAETGSIGLVTNEGNARLVTTLPRVHVALVGLEKLTPTLGDALRILNVLPKNATGQAITSYVSWITGVNRHQSSPDGRKIMHVIFLDNGRRALAKDKVFSQVLRCIRCGACANVCPVYRLVGGHQYGHIYIGAVGLIMTYFFHGRDKARFLVQNCINCGACKEVCAAGIDLPRLIREIHARIRDEDGHPVSSRLLGLVMKNRFLFHGLLKNMRWVQKPLVDKKTSVIRHLPVIFMKDQKFRRLPPIAERAFRDEWQEVGPRVSAPRVKVALFSGCVQDFVYPEQIRAAVRVIAATGQADLDFPLQQTCCGLPLVMMGEKAAAIEVARQNLSVMDPDRYDYVLTMCASCASYLKNAYPLLLKDDPVPAIKARKFADRVIDFSSFVHHVLDFDFGLLKRSAKKIGYHAPCHLCRGLAVHDASRDILARVFDYVPTSEEEVCCGFGGTYALKFPNVSKALLSRKITHLRAANIQAVATDCPGCVMQIRGGMQAAGEDIQVLHPAELLAGQLK